MAGGPGPSVPQALVPADAALQDGDAAWWGGRRGRGARAWRRALRRADGEDPVARSLRIRARIRLQRAGTTLSPLVRAGGLNRDSRACPPADPWCQLAFVDVYLFGPSPALGRNLELARQGLDALEEVFPARVAARRAWLEARPEAPPVRVPGQPIPDTPPVAVPDVARSTGLGRGLAAPGVDLFPVPPTVLAVGLVADPALGVGVSGAWSTADGLRRRWIVDLQGAAATSGGLGRLSVGTPPGPWQGWAVVDGARTRFWDGEGWAPIGRLRVEAGPRRWWGPVWVDVRPVLRWDSDPGSPSTLVAGHGARGAVGVWARRPTEDGLRWRGAVARLDLDASVPGLADYGRVGIGAEVRAGGPVGRGQVVGRLSGQAVRAPDQPGSRVPFLGGSQGLRGLPAGAGAGPVVGLASVEGRHPVVGVLWAAVFADVGATPDGPVPGAGVGLRFMPPPAVGRPVRVDLGVSPLGLQLHVGVDAGL